VSLSRGDLVHLRSAVAFGLGYVDADRAIREIVRPSPARDSLAEAWNMLTEEIGDGIFAPVIAKEG
jgi:hypothetical protein